MQAFLCSVATCSPAVDCEPLHWRAHTRSNIYPRLGNICVQSKHQHICVQSEHQHYIPHHPKQWVVHTPSSIIPSLRQETRTHAGCGLHFYIDLGWNTFTMESMGCIPLILQSDLVSDRVIFQFWHVIWYTATTVSMQPLRYKYISCYFISKMEDGIRMNINNKRHHPNTTCPCWDCVLKPLEWCQTLYCEGW